MFLMYTPLPSEKAAKELALQLVEKKLIACSNIVKSSSMYVWEGELKDGSEWILIGKTNRDVTKDVEALHPYECPCVVTFEAKANEKYVEWMSSVIGSKDI